MNLVIFRRNFDGILSEFHGYSQKMMKCLEFLIKSARKMRKKAENSGIGAKFHSFISSFQSYPYGAGGGAGVAAHDDVAAAHDDDASSLLWNDPMQ